MDVLNILPSSAFRFGEVKKAANVFLPELVDAMRNRYSFWEFPKASSDWNMETGAKFIQGRLGRTIFANLQIFGTGIIVQGAANTSELDAVIVDFMEWSKKEFGVEYAIGTPVPTAAASALEVRASSNLAAPFDKLSGIAAKLSGMVEGAGIVTPPYELAGFTLQTDLTKTPGLQPGRFAFERRASRPFEENVFYSEAPVTTDEHLELLRDLEAAIAPTA